MQPNPSMSTMIKLMVVDDSTLIRRKIIRESDQQKFVIVADASNGLEAVDRFVEHQPQVVTMDLTMPELDGIGCIEKLMALDPDIHILVISALSDQSIGIEAIEKGAAGFLIKPLTQAQLLDALTIISEDIER